MIYLDNNATTKVLPEVRDEMIKYLTEEYGNPSSKYYDLALTSSYAIKKARTSVSKLFGCESDEVIFTSGATESNNFIIKGIADVQEISKNHIITSKIEHPSVLNTVKYLQTKGFDATFLNVNNYGVVELKDLEESITPQTFLVSIMWVNNELGSINNIKEIAELCKNKNVYLHVDATQAVGKVDVTLPDGVNFVSFSGHKIYGPKGIGIAIIRKDQDRMPIKITPLLHGGEQENDLRAGTQSVHNIVGLGKACEIVMRDFDKNQRILHDQEEFLINVLKDKLGDQIFFNSCKEHKVKGTINFQIKGVKNVIFLKKIAPYIAASAGSACSITHPSYTLKAIGLTDEEIQQSIRFSLSPYEDITNINNIL